MTQLQDFRLQVGAEAANRILHSLALFRFSGRPQQVFKRANFRVKLVVRDQACASDATRTLETDFSQPPIIRPTSSIFPASTP